jgi:hypothetical protein
MDDTTRLMLAEAELEDQRHKRMVAEQKLALLEARQREAVEYLGRLQYSPLRDKVLGILRGEK